MNSVWYDLKASEAIGNRYQFTEKFITKLTDPEELEGRMGGTPLGSSNPIRPLSELFFRIICGVRDGRIPTESN